MKPKRTVGYWSELTRLVLSKTNLDRVSSSVTLGQYLQLLERWLRSEQQQRQQKVMGKLSFDEDEKLAPVMEDQPSTETREVPLALKENPKNQLSPSPKKKAQRTRQKGD